MAAHLLLPVLTAALLLAGGCTDRPDAQTDRPAVFMWTGGPRLVDQAPATLMNELRFAARHGIVPYASGVRDSAGLRRYLRRARRAGIEDVWIEIGPRTDATAEQFATDPARRAPTLRRFRALARALQAEGYPTARITIFDEAPLGAFASVPVDSTPTGRSYRADLADFRAHGPAAFAQMQGALTSVLPEARVGVFLHHPHNASPATAGRYSIIDAFMADAADAGGTPAFIFSDVYRGYFNRGYGTEATNRYITDVVAHTDRVADRYSAQAYQLGQVHTIKLGYTPSRRQIDTNVDAMLDGTPDGIGWYWPNYASTDRVKGPDGSPNQPTGYDVSFDPFVPNSWGRLGPAGALYSTSKDRFTYSYFRALEATGRLDPDTRFDLWLYGYDLDHAEHTVLVKPARDAPDAAWDTLGTISAHVDRSGYVETARPRFMRHGNDRWRAVAFRGLRRDRFFGPTDRAVGVDTSGGPALRLRLASADTSDGSRLAAAYALPYRPTRHYATAETMKHHIETQPRWVATNSLARHVRPVAARLTPDTTVTLRLTGEAPPRPDPSARWRSRLDAGDGSAGSEGSGGPNGAQK
jgi:hypothetical protein